MLFKVIILFCSISLSPLECTETTANQKLESTEFTNSLECYTQGQPWFAKLAIKPIPGKEYPKTICQKINK